MRFRREEVIHTEEELRALCVEWQETLRLQDWEIKLSIQRGRQMDGERNAGTVEWITEKKLAKILILSSQDFPPDGEIQDMEKTLVHELLHLHHYLDVFESGSLQDNQQEIAIELTAQALVALKRGAKKE